ncbi:hypothetical protein LROSL1_1206 [Furfurilactobacillus rossiae]|uniref:hypothetical protein n=1 Tax=Furfurilactobacillus rossiae TaxID=231049 RepID=UPI0015BE6959|nr:hypothetical protein [Furfurilactobacillus rossiae]QLE64023.1 hypothetical protein LROSL1_1206 [Furfurilactobacillus rossiae]
MIDWSKFLDFVNKSGLLPFIGGLLASTVSWLNSRGRSKGENDLNSIKILNAAIEERDKNYNEQKRQFESLQRKYDDLERELEHYKEEHPE